MTGVISSSPQKSSQPGSSTRTNRLNGELFPEEEEDDDFSLLAASLAAEPEALVEEEEEVDDATLLAVEMMPETKKVEVVDYLEGITAEMFGDDDGFDQCDSDIYNEEEEQVEALPDAHYGLVGSGKVLLQPQGCMDDLPDEVLRQVLCLVPAQDLYRSVSRVCHHWRNIVQDTKVKQTTELQ